MTALADRFGQALCWTGFRPLSPAEASSGPLAQNAAQTGYVRLDANTYNCAFILDLKSEVDAIQFMEQLGLATWGYDLNLEGHAAQTELVNEAHFVLLDEHGSMLEELPRLGFRQHAGSWLRVDRDCLVPDLGPDFRGEIFPCLGWVLLPDTTSEFGPAEQRSGFCTKDVPKGAVASRDVRGYRFVHDGYPQRVIARRRIIKLIAPGTSSSDARAIVESALAQTYREM